MPPVLVELTPSAILLWEATAASVVQAVLETDTLAVCVEETREAALTTSVEREQSAGLTR